jgi:membrane protein YqaA with SNARE-associated domain
MDSFFIDLGYFGLFVVAFISATLIPAATEVVMMGMVGLGFSVLGMLVVASAGNFLGAIFNYHIGSKGIEYLRGSRFFPGDSLLCSIESWFRKWGKAALFFSWLPFVGDPLTVVAGLLRMPLRSFLPWVFAGRFIRYAGILYLGEAVLGRMLNLTF